MSTIKSSAENLTLNADGANNDIKFQSNGSEVASIDQAGLVTATSLNTTGNILAGATAIPSGAGGDVPQFFLKQGASGSGISSVANGNDAFIRMYHDGTTGKLGTTYGASAGYTSLSLETGGVAQLTIDATGAVTMPKQPAFLARPSSTQSDLATGGVTIAMGTEVFDNNADFSSNTFTAPVAGRYLLSSNLYMGNLDSASQYYQLEIKTSNRIYYDSIGMSGFNADVIYYTLQCTVLADMDANDTAYTYVQIPNGTAQADVFDISHFSGYLVA